MHFVLVSQEKNLANTLPKKIKSVYFNKLENVFLSAVKKALEKKRQINIVFSPACSSFDQYKNFEHRGNEFKTLVSKIIKNARQKK